MSDGFHGGRPSCAGLLGVGAHFKIALDIAVSERKFVVRHPHLSRARHDRMLPSTGRCRNGDSLLQFICALERGYRLIALDEPTGPSSPIGARVFSKHRGAGVATELGEVSPLHAEHRVCLDMETKLSRNALCCRSIVS